MKYAQEADSPQNIVSSHEMRSGQLKALSESGWNKGYTTMNLTRLFPFHAINYLYLALLQAGVPGEGLLNSIAQFITGPFGKAITLIAIVLCGVSYMYGKQSDNSSIGRLAIGAALIVGAANIFAYIQQAG
jgi:type IV secretory pathway VirB2 component (pilin)